MTPDKRAEYYKAFHSRRLNAEAKRNGKHPRKKRKLAAELRIARRVRLVTHPGPAILCNCDGVVQSGIALALWVQFIAARYPYAL